MSKIHSYKGVDYSPKNVNNELIPVNKISGMLKNFKL